MIFLCRLYQQLLLLYPLSDWRSRDTEAEGTAAAEVAACPSQQTQPSKVPKVVGNRVEAEENFLCSLEQIQSFAIVFSSYKPSLRESSSRSSVIRRLSCPMTSLHKAEYEKLSEDQLLSQCETFLKGILVIHHDEAAYLSTNQIHNRMPTHQFLQHRVYIL